MGDGSSDFSTLEGLSLLSASLFFGFRSASLGWLLFGKIEGGCQSKGARSWQKRLSVKLCRGSIPLKVSPSPSSAAELVGHYHIPPPCLRGKQRRADREKRSYV